jgi:protein gp37
MRTTKIEWTDKTWNPITGCTKKSAGCAHCYAEKMSCRLNAMGLKKYRNQFTLTLHEEDLEEPQKWRQAHNIFVCSMSDIFHEQVPFAFVDKIMQTIKSTPQHRYQILTKRAERMADYFTQREIPGNVWLGVTVECKETIYRIDYLRKLKASIKFLSCEPLLEDLGILNLEGINWVIAGGESGSQARPMKPEWVLNLQGQVEQQHIAFFFKQWGTWGSDGIKRSKHTNGKLLNGKIIQQMPAAKPQGNKASIPGVESAVTMSAAQHP